MKNPADTLKLEIVNPNRPDVIELITELDAHLTDLYEPKSRHFLDIDSLTKPNIRFVLASVDGQAAGCGALRIWDDYAEVKRMYVKPDHRGSGVGYRILAKLEEIAREAGFSVTRLETGIHQHASIKLYEGFGYVRRPPFGEYTNDPVSLCYEKQLAAK